MPLAGEPFFGFSAGNLRQSMEIALWLPAQFAHVGLKFDFFQPTYTFARRGKSKIFIERIECKIRTYIFYLVTEYFEQYNTTTPVMVSAITACVKS